MIKVCVFDLDGTLLNTLPTIAHHVNAMLVRYGIAPYEVKDYLAFVGDGSRRLLCRALEGRGVRNVDIEPFHREYVEGYDRASSYLTVPYDGVSEMLATLRAHGCRLAVFSNKPESSVRLLVEEFFPSTFDLVRGARVGEEAKLKPAPDLLFEILDELGASPDECFYLGDGIPDMKLAKNAAVALPVAALWGYTDAERLLHEGGFGAKTPKEAAELFLQSLQ